MGGGQHRRLPSERVDARVDRCGHARETVRPDELTANVQAESSERPLRRRADKMARPARVCMRSRKPCVLARRRLFGWKVRLLTVRLHQ